MHTWPHGVYYVHMELDFFKMDIFFVITSVVVLVHGVLFAVLLYYLTKVVRDVSEITARVKIEANEIADDVREVREDIKDGIESAKEYTKQAVAGASIVRGVSNLMQAFMEEKERSGTRRRSSKKKAE